MGVDAVIRIEPVPPRDVVERLQEEFSYDWSTEWTNGDSRWPSIDDRGELCSMWRYYGPGYERGEWPKIRRAIEWLIEHSGLTVCYGGDYDPESAEPMTPEAIAALQAHYDAVGNKPYSAARGVPPNTEAPR